MTKLNITRGQWEAEQSTPTVQVIHSGLANIASVNTWNVEGEHNAQLIADAGTTYNECGLLPSELLKQRNELLGALKALVAWSNIKDGSPSQYLRDEAIKAIRNAENSQPKHFSI